VPKQVWQAEDGRIFDTQEACERHEKTGALYNLLFDSQTGQKKNIGNYEELHDALSETWSHMQPGFFSDEDRDEVAELLVILHKSTHIQERRDLVLLSAAMQRLGAYLENKDQ